MLEGADTSWSIYQDSNDICFRTAKPRSARYEKGMTHCSLEQLMRDIGNNSLLRVF